MTALAKAIGTQDTLVQLSATLDVGSLPAPYLIDSEAILITGGDLSALVSVLRAQNGTAAATHASGAALTAGWYTGGQTADVQAALDGANSPSGANVFATMADVGGGGLPTGWTQDGDPAVLHANSGAIDGLAGIDAQGASVNFGGGTLLMSGGSVNLDGSPVDLGPGGSISGSGASISTGDATWSDSGLNTFGGTITTMGGSGAGTGRFKGAIGVNGAVPNTPVIPLTTPTVQNVIDALVALGLVTQSD